MKVVTLIAHIKRNIKAINKKKKVDVQNDLRDLAPKAMNKLIDEQKAFNRS